MPLPGTEIITLRLYGSKTTQKLVVYIHIFYINFLEEKSPYKKLHSFKMYNQWVLTPVYTYKITIIIKIHNIFIIPKRSFLYLCSEYFLQPSATSSYLPDFCPHGLVCFFIEGITSYYHLLHLTYFSKIILRLIHTVVCISNLFLPIAEKYSIE